MQKQFVILSVVALLVFAALTGLAPRAADASGFETPAGVVDSTDADFCFTGTSGIGVPCNSACFGLFSIFSYNISLPVYCPGPPAAIAFASSPTNVSCASQSTLSVTVTDAAGNPVADDTLVTFTTDAGTVSPSASTNSGLATVSLTVPTKTSGVARIAATIGGVRGDKSVAISC